MDTTQFDSAISTTTRFRVIPMPHGVRRVEYVGEMTARNTARDALGDIAYLAERAGLRADLEISGRGELLFLTPEEGAECNDIGHHRDCECPECLPEAYDPAELEAGRSDRRVA